jgi:hypothetical protein
MSLRYDDSDIIYPDGYRPGRANANGPARIAPSSGPLAEDMRIAPFPPAQRVAPRGGYYALERDSYRDDYAAPPPPAPRGYYYRY